MKKLILALALGAGLTVAGLVNVQAEDKKKVDAKKKVERPKRATLGELAPNFTLTDINGKKHTLSEYAGKYVVLEWVNYDCPFVKKHYRTGNMQKLQKKYKKKGVVWLAICSSAPGKQGYYKGEKLKKRIAYEKAEHSAYLLDPTGRVGKKYMARTTPHMYIIGPKQRLVYMGAIDSIKSWRPSSIKKAINFVSQILDARLSGKKVKPKATPPYGCSVKYDRRKFKRASN